MTILDKHSDAKELAPENRGKIDRREGDLKKRDLRFAHAASVGLAQKWWGYITATFFAVFRPGASLTYIVAALLLYHGVHLAAGLTPKAG